MKRSPSSLRVVQTSFWVDVSDIILNVAVAILSGSAVMLAQSLQGGADLITSALLMIGVKRSGRKADKLHPFGYGREIYFWTLIAGLMMITITATISFHEGWERLLSPRAIEYSGLSLLVLFVGFITNSYAFSVSYQRLKAAHQKAQSLWDLFTGSVFVETKATFVLDLMGAVSGLFGLISIGLYVVTGDPQIVALGSMVIGVTTAVLAILLVLDVKDLLVGRGAAPELEDDIRATALAIKGVDAVLDLKTMYMGSERLLVNMELDIDEKLKTEEIERLMDIIKAEVRDKVPTVHHIQLELETPRKYARKLSLTT